MGIRQVIAAGACADEFAGAVKFGESGANVKDEAEERKAGLLSAAEDAIVELGYDVVRLRDIAKRAGVSVGMIQHYFESRDELLLEAMTVASERRATEWATLGDREEAPLARTKALLRGSVADRQRCLAWMTMCSESTRHPDLFPLVSHIYDAWFEALRLAIEDGIEKGAFTPLLPVNQTLDALMALIDGLMVAAGVSIRDFDRDYSAELLENSAGLLLRCDFGTSEEAESSG